MLVQKSFLCIRITYISQFLSNLLISNILSSNYALVSRLGQNLSNVPRSVLSKQKFPLILPLSTHKDFKYYLFNKKISLILPLSEHKAFRSYLFSLDLPPFLAQNFVNQVECCALKQQIYTQSFLSFPQFPTITVSGRGNVTIYWHRGRQRFKNAPTKP